MPWPFEIDDLAINDQAWTAVTVPWDCSSVGIKNCLSVDVQIKTDEAVDVISAGCQELITADYYPTYHGATRRCVRFGVSSTIAFLKSTSGSGTVKLRFLA